MEFIIEAEMILGRPLDYLLLTYFDNGKWGIFHPEFGILVSAEYDQIEMIENEIYLFTGKRKRKWKPSKNVKLYFQKYKST
jgi:hypothetical protein